MGQLHTKLNHKNPRIRSEDPFSFLSKTKAALNQHQDRLHRFARTWDSSIRKMLKDMSRAKWPDQHWLGVFPVFSTRIRREAGPQKISWWVEHDIPPYDRYRCEAYFVELELDESLNIILTVRSRSEKYVVEQPITASLAHNLAKAALDPPAIIPRRMGSAFD